MTLRTRSEDGVSEKEWRHKMETRGGIREMDEAGKRGRVYGADARQVIDAIARAI